MSDPSFSTACSASVIRRSSSRKSVRFARLAKVYCIPALTEISEEEVAAIWTNGEDMQQTQANVVSAIRALRNGDASLDDEDGPSSRGLEHMVTEERMERRQRNKRRVYDAVLDAQFQFQEQGISPDDEAIASASERHSQWARDVARALGTSDAEYVRQHVCPPQAGETDEEENQYNKEEEQESQFYARLVNALGLSSEASYCDVDSSTPKDETGVTAPRRSKCPLPNREGKSRRALPQPSLKKSQSVLDPNESLYDRLVMPGRSKVLNKIYQDESQRMVLRCLLKKDTSRNSVGPVTRAATLAYM
mmetsp:Transcript_4739/g.10066  ORF Transcript_4739/g.10066 Transcript_4739/m.10066 type:complete len:306 (+) Transcript_4739:104-1021(+)